MIHGYYTIAIARGKPPQTQIAAAAPLWYDGGGPGGGKPCCVPEDTQMTVREIIRPDASTFARLSTLLTDAFWKTPLFTDFLFRGRKPLARTFLEALLQYGLRAGRTFVAEDGERGIVACALWSGPDAPEFNLKTWLRLGIWPRMASIALRSPAAMGRILELFVMLDRYAPEEPCATLEFLASEEKGAGAAVVLGSLSAFAGWPLYVESIVSKNDHAYYKQFGFVPFAQTDFHGTDYAFMRIDA